MGLGGLIRFAFHRGIELIVISVLIVLMPNIPPNANFSKSTSVTPTKPLENKLALNNKLDDVEIWHKGDMHGPEAFAEWNGELYTTIHGGDVVKLVGNHITPIVKFGKPCKGFYQEAICGRPLGLAFDKSGTLYVADSYYGVFKVDLSSGKKQRLAAVNDVIDGNNVTLPNSIAIASNGDLYWTDSSTEFQLHDGLFDVFADGSGRLIHYNAQTKQHKVLINDLHFANGVVLSDNEEYVIVSETMKSRLLKYYVKGPKKGTKEVFVDGLPGLPDNLKSDGKGGVLIPLVISTDPSHPYPGHFLAPFPYLRKFVARLMGLAQGGFKIAQHVYPHEYFERIVHFIGHFEMGSFATPKRVTIVHVDKNGNILDSLHTVKGKLSGISEVHIFKDTLYLGSPFNDYVGRISLEKVGWQHLKSAPQPKLTTTTPKPTTTTTTPKPTTTTTTTPKPTTTTTTTQKPTTTTKPATTTTATPKVTTTTAKPPPAKAQAKPSQTQNVKDQPKKVPVQEGAKNN